MKFKLCIQPLAPVNLIILKLIQVVITTWLVITANGYTFQKPVRPSVVHYPMASHLNTNTGGYGGQQSWVPSGVNGHPVAGTRGLQTPRQPIATNTRSYFPKQSYVPVPQSVPKAPVTAGSRTYQVQHGTQGPPTVKTKLPYAPKVSVVMKPTSPKPSEKTVDTLQPYPSGPAIARHIPVHGTGSSYSSAVKAVPAEASHHQSTGSLTTNMQPPRWIPSYGVGVNKAAENASHPSVPAPAGQVSIMEMKKKKETTNDGLTALHEAPLQTAVLIIRKPSQKVRITPNRENSDVPATVSDTMLQPIVPDYQAHASLTVTETMSTNPSTPVEPDVASYQNLATHIPPTSFQPDILPSSPVITYQDGLTQHLASENENLQLQPDVPIAHQLPELLASTEANVLQFLQPMSPESSGEYAFQPVSPTSDSTIPVIDNSSSGHNKSPSNDQQQISVPAMAYQLPQQSSYSASINLQAIEEVPPQVAESNEAASFEPNYFTKDAQHMLVEEPLALGLASNPPAPSFADSAIPKYVLGPYSSLVLPEPPLELASSAYGVLPLGVDETQPILASPQTDSTQLVGNYGIVSLSLDNIQHLPLQQQWGYYSAEPFPSSSSNIGQVNIPPTSMRGYQQSFTTPEVNNPQSSYGFQQSSTSQQQSGYPFSQESTAGSNIPYQTTRQTVTTETLNNFRAAANQWISSNGAHIEGRQHFMGSDKVPVSILSSENVLNQDGSFSYK